jgi:hypothetical protein
MSTIKSSAENLTLNADGANNDIKFQSNGSEVASIDQAGKLTSGSVAVTGDIYLNDNQAFRSGGQALLARYDPVIEIGSGDGQDYLKFKAGGDERMRIDATGAVTMPSQPAFCVTATSGGLTNITSASNWNTAVLQERFDNNADFSSNTFTAPVTGKYQLNALVYFIDVDTASAYTEAQILTSNKGYQFIVSTNQFASDLTYFCLSSSVLADMDANDTAILQVNIQGGTSQTDLSTQTTFSGYLVA